MKILLDENIDVHFKHELSEYEIRTVKDNGWVGIENGKLLNLIRNEFDVFITLDSNLRHQQNISDISLHIIILKAKDSRLAHLKLFTLIIKNLLDKVRGSSKFEVIEISL